MERLQRLATHMIKGMRELSYGDRLRRWYIFSLERRWLGGDFSLAYNIFASRLDWPQAVFLRHQGSETFEDTTTSCATAVVAYSGGKQPSL